MPRRTLLALLAVLAAGGLAPTAAPAFVRDCRARADYNLVIVKVRNMSCGAAKFDMRRHRRPIYRRFRTPAGFLCTRVSGTALAGRWRCVRGARAYRFDFAD